jgi:hypothetical protein
VQRAPPTIDPLLGRGYKGAVSSTMMSPTSFIAHPGGEMRMIVHSGGTDVGLRPLDASGKRTLRFELVRD